MGSCCTSFLPALTARCVFVCTIYPIPAATLLLSAPQLCHFRMAEAELLGHWALLAKLTLEDSGDGPLSRATEETLLEVCTYVCMHVRGCANKWYCVAHHNAQCSYVHTYVHMPLKQVKRSLPKCMRAFCK